MGRGLVVIWLLRVAWKVFQVYLSIIYICIYSVIGHRYQPPGKGNSNIKLRVMYSSRAIVISLGRYVAACRWQSLGNRGGN